MITGSNPSYPQLQLWSSVTANILKDFSHLKN